MTKKLLIMGSTGMVGNTVAHYFSNNSLYATMTTHRTKGISNTKSSLYLDALSEDFGKLPTDFDYVINCIGIIKPFMDKNPIASIKINAIFPLQLSEWCAAHNIGLLHISTDCVYSGSKGEYIESDLPDALDAYGKSKFLGECPDNAMVIRTSIVGEEINGCSSLISWAKSQRGKTVRGYSTHLWNGITARKFAQVCDKIIVDKLYEPGCFHVFAQDDVSKLQMLHYFNEKFNLELSIVDDRPIPINRTLRSEKKLNAKLSIPTVKQMIEEMQCKS